MICFIKPASIQFLINFNSLYSNGHSGGGGICVYQPHRVINHTVLLLQRYSHHNVFNGRFNKNRFQKMKKILFLFL